MESVSFQMSLEARAEKAIAIPTEKKQYINIKKKILFIRMPGPLITDSTAGFQASVNCNLKHHFMFLTKTKCFPSFISLGSLEVFIRMSSEYGRSLLC